MTASSSSAPARAAAGPRRLAGHAGGSDRPELAEVRIGFMPLTDCASVVMAAALGFDRRHGIRIVPQREASWAGVRDKLCNGSLDMAHALYGLVYGVHLGIGGPRKDMAVLMTLNQNGQGLSLSRTLGERGIAGLDSLAARIRGNGRPHIFAQTFPTGTHAMWLYSWLASAGINPFGDVDVVTVAPPQMIANMRHGDVDGFSVGEPWNHRAIAEGVAVSVASSQDIWPDHPEKVLGCTAAFADRHPNTARAVVMALLDASRWIDASVENRTRMAAELARPEVLGCPVDNILPRVLGHYQNGLGRSWQDPHHLRFFADGAVNFPYLSDGMWFLTQYRRWGLLREHPDYLGIARRINRIDLYREAAAALSIDVPTDPLRSSRLIDGGEWNGRDPAAYADSFPVRAPAPSLDPA